MEIITNKSAAEDIGRWGFTYAEVEELGIAAAAKFSMIYGTDLMNMNRADLKALYRDLIENPVKYKRFCGWLKPRFEKFIELEIPLRIYVGGEKQFLHRGDEKLERSLIKVQAYIDEYISKNYITSERITLILYYLNLIFK